MGSKLSVAQNSHDKEASAMEGILRQEEEGIRKQEEEGKGSGERRREGYTCEGDGCIKDNCAADQSPESLRYPAAQERLVKEEDFHMQFSANDDERYRLFKEEMEEKNRLLMEDSLRFKESSIRKEHELCDLVNGLEHNLYRMDRRLHSRTARHGEEVLALNQELNHYKQYCGDLRLQIERAEHLHSQQSMADSGSYQDSAATPPLLQQAADAVKDAITVCASDLSSRIKKNSLPINLPHMNIDAKGTAQMVKVAWQNFLCHIFFKCFEDPYFFMSNDIIPPFDKPASRKNQFLQAYKQGRDMDAGQMHDKNADFTHFFNAKASDVCMELKEQILMIDDTQRKENFISLELCCLNSSFYGKLLRLAKAVWVLHKLAFAFEPIAEIFRVGQNSILDEEFMEDIADDDDEDSNDNEQMAENANTVKHVRFMCVPGFTVRRTIIKSRVFSIKKCQARGCENKADPSPMALE